jgi:hypothetical protein
MEQPGSQVKDGRAQGGCVKNDFSETQRREVRREKR